MLLNHPKNTRIQVENLGIMDYSSALLYQEKCWERVKAGSNDYLLFLQHNPVITLGRRTDPSHVHYAEDELLEKGIELFKVDRGGSATYHGPGQLIGYMISKVSRFGGIHRLVSLILESLEKSITKLGISCFADHKNPGIWTKSENPKKLAAVGMHVKEGITLHGFAVNVDMSLAGFSTILPCGLNQPVSTLSIELEKSVNIDDFRDIISNILLRYVA